MHKMVLGLIGCWFFRLAGNGWGLVKCRRLEHRHRPDESS